LSLPGKVSNIRDVVTENRFEGVGANSIKEMNLNLLLSETIKEDKVVINENSWNHRILEKEDIVLQDYLVPTARGNLIKCLYFIEVSFTHAGLTLGSVIPKIVFPIYMLAPEINLVLHPI